MNEFTWQAIGFTLLERLDHPDQNLRASAAYQIGQFCNLLFCEWHWREDYAEDILDYSCLEDGTCKWVFESGVYEEYERSIVGLPALVDMMQLIRSKEIEKPGIAAAWLTGSKIGLTNIDVGEWILDLLENSPTPEPYIPDFPCNLAFYAHELFSQNCHAIRRLMNMGRLDIAIHAATDESCKIESLEPLLIEMGNYDDLEVVRLASWQLAYYYHYLHPNGVKFGYVEKINGLPEIDLFLLFSRHQKSESPYAVVLYAKEKNQILSRLIAQKWIDQIFPEFVRGAIQKEQSASHSSIWYQCGYIDYSNSDINSKSEELARVIIGYRSEIYWNPKLFLEPWI
jgi:hypothetical protein